MTAHDELVKTVVFLTHVLGVIYSLGTVAAASWLVYCLREKAWGWAFHALLVTAGWAFFTWLFLFSS